jgi:hypothetical protein
LVAPGEVLIDQHRHCAAAAETCSSACILSAVIVAREPGHQAQIRPIKTGHLQFPNRILQGGGIGKNGADFMRSPIMGSGLALSSIARSYLGLP